MAILKKAEAGRQVPEPCRKHSIWPECFLLVPYGLNGALNMTVRRLQTHDDYKNWKKKIGACNKSIPKRHKCRVEPKKPNAKGYYKKSVRQLV